MSSRELEKFTKQFIQKAVQVIVQSRLGGDRIRTNSNRNGNDWFNISIPDLPDITEQTKKSVESLGNEVGVNSENDNAKKGFCISTEWRLCCEISLKTTEGETMVLEYWFITNEVAEPNSPTQTKAAMHNSAIYDIYNKMGLMLKSLITLARATPAFKISSSGQSADSYVVCYRVYQSDYLFENILKTKSKEAQHYTNEVKMGTIHSIYNRLTISLAYRKDMISCGQSEENSNDDLLMPVNDHFNEKEKVKLQKPVVTLDEAVKPMIAAFASSPSSEENFSRILLNHFHFRAVRRFVATFAGECF